MFYFRLDVGPKFGLGHLFRVRALINYLEIKAYRIVIDKFYNNNFLKYEKDIICLYKNNKVFKDELHDAKLFSKLIKNKNKSLVVVDSYRIGFKWEKYISKFCKKIIVIDDFIDKKHYSDVYINHSPLFTEKEKLNKINFKKINKRKCQFLLGPEYALFNSEKKNKDIKSDIVFFNGGSGDPLVYKNIINSLLKKNGKLRISIIIGPYVRNIKNSINKLKKIKNLNLIINSNNILNVINGTKLLVSSAGTSMFESSFLNIPTLLFKMNSNQNLDDIDYEKLGHFFCLKKNDLKFTKKIIELIDLMINDSYGIKKMMKPFVLKLKKIRNNYQKQLGIY